jgi:5'-3' exonuclease
MAKYAVIIDYSGFWYIAYGAALNAGVRYNLDNTTIVNAQGKLRTFKAYLEKHNIKEFDLIFAEDRPATRKLAIHPGYRAGRQDNSFLKSKLKEHLLENGHPCSFVHSDGNEADDVIATLVSKANKQEGMFTVIFSGDRDLWQLISPTTTVFNPSKKSFVSTEDTNKAFSVTPIHIPLVKALWGDYGDCVPNAIPRTQKQLLPIVRQTQTGEFTEFKELLYSWIDCLTPKCQNLISKGMNQAEINWDLVKLDSNCTLLWD